MNANKTHRGRIGYNSAVLTVFSLMTATVFYSCFGGPTTPSRTFLLSQCHVLADYDGPVQVRFPIEPGVRVGVGPVKIAEYLNRPQMISRIRANEIQVQEFHRWAEPLKDSLPRVLAQNISWLLTSDLVFAFPWSSSVKPDYQVTVDVLRLDGRPGGDVWLEALWTLYDGNRTVLQESRRASFTVTSTAPDFEQLVDAHNQLLFLLSLRISATLHVQSLAAQSPPQDLGGR